jgi:hypothetical protein
MKMPMHLHDDDFKQYASEASFVTEDALHTTFVYNLHAHKQRCVYLYEKVDRGYRHVNHYAEPLIPPFTHEEHERCPNGYIFVFGSNLAGRHGRGAALYARAHFGARLGVGVGLTGQAYALPTKDAQLKTLPLDRIAEYVDAFIQTAASMPEMFFWLTPVGTGLAGYTHDDIAPLFQRKVLENIVYPSVWCRHLFT